MKILTVDIGTGTQDIYLYDSQQDMENGIKLILPSPTLIIFRKLQKATSERTPVVLTGTTIGGGPSSWAAEKHIAAGLDLFATPDAAKSFNDDLEVVQSTGIKIVSEDEAKALSKKILCLDMKDFDFKSILDIFHQYSISLKGLASVAVAVFDHGSAPVGISDRKFRFDYLDERIRKYNRLSAFAYLSGEIPPTLTRMKAISETLKEVQASVVVMDTAPAAVLGAQYDEFCNRFDEKLVVNIGNFHTLAFKMSSKGIGGVFEHHTGFLDEKKLEGLLENLAHGVLQNSAVFEDHGHGALVYNPEPMKLHSGNLIVTGPRRRMLQNSKFSPHFAVPFGDMMISGCFGVLAAVADIMPEYAEQIHASLKPSRSGGLPPWEIFDN